MEFITNLNQFLWGCPLLILLLGTHLYFTIKLQCPQKHIGKALKMSVSADPSIPTDDTRPKISAFAALSTTLAATLGTGNIIGVSTAVALGGPGAIFWCWITGIFGMATAYAECYLGVLFKEKNKEGHYVGGPMYVIKNGLHNKPLSIFYAICTVIAAFGVEIGRAHV